MKFSYEGNKIRRLREEALYSRDLLARMARTTYWIVGRVENQFYKSIDGRLIEDLEAALGVHPNAISDDYYPPTLPYIQRVRYNPELLKARRKELRLTLEQVGERAGVSLEVVAKLEGKDIARPETMRRVCRALGLNPQDVSPAFKIIPSASYTLRRSERTYSATPRSRASDSPPIPLARARHALRAWTGCASKKDQIT